MDDFYYLVNYLSHKEIKKLNYNKQYINKNICECGEEYIEIDENDTIYKVCNGCGYMKKKFKLLSNNVTKKKSFDFPFRVQRNVKKFNMNLPFSENLLSNYDINFICYIIKNTRKYLKQNNRVKMFHTKYILYIILDYMKKEHLLKYFKNINKKTNDKYRSIFYDIYNKLFFDYLNYNEF